MCKCAMEKSLCPKHKDPPGIVTENIKLNWNIAQTVSICESAWVLALRLKVMLLVL